MSVSLEQEPLPDTARALDLQLVGIGQTWFGETFGFNTNPKYYQNMLSCPDPTEYSGIEAIGTRSHLIARNILVTAAKIGSAVQGETGRGVTPDIDCMGEDVFGLTRRVVELLRDPRMHGLDVGLEEGMCAATELMLERQLQWHTSLDKKPRQTRHPAVVLTDDNDRPIAYQMSEGTGVAYVFSDGYLPLTGERKVFLPRGAIVMLTDGDHFNTDRQQLPEEFILPGKQSKGLGRGLVRGVGPQAYGAELMRLGNEYLPEGMRRACITSSVGHKINSRLRTVADAGVDFRAEVVQEQINEILTKYGSDIMRLSAIEVVSS